MGTSKWITLLVCFFCFTRPSCCDQSTHEHMQAPKKDRMAIIMLYNYQPTEASKVCVVERKKRKDYALWGVD